MELLGKIFTVNRVIQILLAFLFLVNVAEGLFGPILSVFIVQTIPGATLATAGFSIAIYSIVKSLIQVPLAFAIDRKEGERDDYLVMMTGAMLGIAYSLGYAYVDSVMGLYLLSAIGGAGGAFLMAAYYSLFARHADKGAEGFEWSLFSVGGLTVSSALGAAGGGMLAEAIGFRNLFSVSAALLLCATILLLFLSPYLKNASTTSGEPQPAP
ncbi:MAG TPA: MFS transporter [Candidatus Paceibacterota bacterium]|nr:MFS transporter [Candidatus Paceibacterota bacterium]